MRVKISLGGKQLHHPVLFIKGLQVPCILGMDFMSRARVIIDTQNQKIRMGDFPHFHAEDNPTLINKMTDILHGKDHSVPPLLETKVICTVSTTFEHGLISNSNGNNNFHIMYGVIKLRNNGSGLKECFAIVLNTGRETINLTKNSVIGKFEGLEQTAFKPIDSVLQINQNKRVLVIDTSHLQQVKLDHLPMSVKGKY